MSPAERPVPLSEIIARGSVVQDAQGNTLSGSVPDQRIGSKNYLDLMRSHPFLSSVVIAGIAGAILRVMGPESSPAIAADIRPENAPVSSAPAELEVLPEPWKPVATDCDEPVIEASTIVPIQTPILWNDIADTPESPRDPLQMPAVFRGKFFINACILAPDKFITKSTELSEKLGNGKTVYEIDLNGLSVDVGLDDERIITRIKNKPSYQLLQQAVQAANPDWESTKVDYEAARLFTVLDGSEEAVVNNVIVTVGQMLSGEYSDVIIEMIKEDVRADQQQSMVDGVYDPADYILDFKEPPADYVLPLGLKPPDQDDLAGPFDFLRDLTRGQLELTMLERAGN